MPDTTFDQVIALYDFDRALKRITLDALERIEVAMRFRVGHAVGRRGAFAHLDIRDFDRRFTQRVNGRPSTYEGRCEKLSAAQKRSKEDFVTHFDTKNDGTLPVSGRDRAARLRRSLVPLRRHTACRSR